MRELRFDVDSIDQLRALVGAALPLGLRSRRVLSIRVAATGADEPVARTRVYAVRVNADEPAEAVRGRNSVARRLRGVVDPRELDVRVALEVERFERTCGLDWLLRPHWHFRFEQVT